MSTEDLPLNFAPAKPDTIPGWYRKLVLAGAYSIADIANFAWVRTANWSGVESRDLEHLSRWIEAIRAWPAVQRGLDMPPKDQLGKTDDEFVKSAQHMVT